MSLITKKGLSLIVLIITIIIIVILAGIIILNLIDTNLLSQTSKARYLSDVKIFQTELELYKTQRYVENLGQYDPKLLHADEFSTTYNGVINTNQTIYDLIPSLQKNSKYSGQFHVISGELIFGGYDINMQEWSRELDIQVVILVEPKITIMPPSEILVEKGIDIKYIIKFSSNLSLTTIDLTEKVKLLNNELVELPIQPVITIGTITGSSLDLTRQVEVIVTTNNLLDGTYKLKVKSGSVINSNNISNTSDTISSIEFSVVDSISPLNPQMVANPSEWTNETVEITINYTEDSILKEYSLDSLDWNDYTIPVEVTENNTTVYARGIDLSGNESGVSTLTVANIDKIQPTVILSDVSATTSSITIAAVADDLGGSGLVASSYQYSKDNGITWTTATNETSNTFINLTTGTYECRVKVADNAGNSVISNSVTISTIGLGTIVLEANPTGWTNGDVTVTIAYPPEIISKEYSTNGTSWNEYIDAIILTLNGTVYARGFDAGGNQTSQASITVVNIDKTPPSEPSMSSTAIIGTSPSSQDVIFSSSTSQSQSKVVTISNLNSITSVAINTGIVSTSVSGNNVTVYASQGTSTSSYWDSTKYSTYASNYLTSSSNSFPSTNYYSSGSYSGTLSKSGSSYVSSGSYTPADSKYISGYNSGISNTYQTFRWNGSSWTLIDEYLGGLPNSISYNSGGYSGTLSKNFWLISESGSPPSNPVIGSTYTVYKSWGYDYYGTVTRPASDTRIYRQDYSGYAYAGGYIYYYSYIATLNYLVGSTTTASVTITYPVDATIKEYSLNGTTWNAYTTPIIVNLGITVYSRCYDATGNVSTTASKVAN